MQLLPSSFDTIGEPPTVALTRAPLSGNMLRQVERPDLSSGPHLQQPTTTMDMSRITKSDLQQTIADDAAGYDPPHERVTIQESSQ